MHFLRYFCKETLKKIKIHKNIELNMDYINKIYNILIKNKQNIIENIYKKTVKK